MQSHAALVGAPPPTSFLSLPFELRDPIYRLMLPLLPRVKPKLSSPTIPIYCLQNLDPRPLFVHSQIQHEIEALLASHTRIQIPAGLHFTFLLSNSTQQWLRESSIEFQRIRICSPLPVPVILDVNILVDGEVAVHYKWRWTRGRLRLYSWGQCILSPHLPVMFKYLAEGLRKRVGARRGTGIRIGEIDFLMESMERFRNWFHVHRRFSNSYFSTFKSSSRLSAGSYEEELAGLRYWGDESKEDFRRRLEWWDDVEADVRDLKMTQSRVLDGHRFYVQY